jgi:hypothetical protein
MSSIHLQNYLQKNEYLCMNRDKAKQVAKAAGIELDNADRMYTGYHKAYNMPNRAVLRVWRKDGHNYYRLESSIQAGAQPLINEDLRQYVDLLGWGGYSAERNS